MAIIEPGTGRAVVKYDGAGLRITIPVTTQNDAAASLLLGLLFWALGEVVIVLDLLGGADGQAGPFFLIIGLPFWTWMGVLVFQWLLWQLAGEEIIELTPTSLRQRKVIPFFSRSREFAVAGIANLRLTPPPSWLGRLGSPIHGLDFKEGAISFDHGRAICFLGTGLDKGEALHVISEMCKRVTSLARRKTQNEGAG